MESQDPLYVEKERTLGFTVEAMGPVQRIFLGYASNRERLTGEPAHEHIMCGDVLLVDFRDVTGNFVAVTGKVRSIGLLAELVPLAREDALASDRLKAEPDPAYTGKQVYEPEIRAGTGAQRLDVRALNASPRLAE